MADIFKLAVGYLFFKSRYFLYRFKTNYIGFIQITTSVTDVAKTGETAAVTAGTATSYKVAYMVGSKLNLLTGPYIEVDNMRVQGNITEEKPTGAEILKCIIYAGAL